MSVETAHEDTFARDRLPPRKLWPEFRFELPELQYPARMNCATELLDQAVVDGHGERTAILADGTTLIYRELLSEANRIARVLTEDLGLVPGNRVLLRSPNNPTLAAAWFAVMKVGGIAVTTMPLLRVAELKQIARKAEISHALYDDRLAQDIFDAAAETGLLSARLGFTELSASASSNSDEFRNVDTSSDDVCLLAFTSGTTGQPKAIMHFHRDVLAMADVVGRHLLQTQPGGPLCRVSTPGLHLRSRCIARVSAAVPCGGHPGRDAKSRVAAGGDREVSRHCPVHRTNDVSRTDANTWRT